MTENKKYEKGSLGWLREQQKIKAKKDGFDDVDKWLRWKIDPFNILEKKYGNEFADWARKNKDKIRKCVIDAGCKTECEYQNVNAQKIGFKNFSDRNRGYSHEAGKYLPIEFNDDSNANFGIYKGEKIFKRFLEENIFEEVIESGKMTRDGGIDLFCKNPKQEFVNKHSHMRLERDKIYKFQLTMSCVIDGYRWVFHIRCNNIADYFILCGWDDRHNMNPIHIWIIHKDEMVRKGTRLGWYKMEKMYNRESISIVNDTKSSMSYIHFQKYELIDELYMLKELCKDTF